jgi:hypothetical protein
MWLVGEEDNTLGVRVKWTKGEGFERKLEKMAEVRGTNDFLTGYGSFQTETIGNAILK